MRIVLEGLTYTLQSNAAYSAHHIISPYGWHVMGLRMAAKVYIFFKHRGGSWKPKRMIDKRIGCRGDFECNTIHAHVHLDIVSAAILHIITYIYIYIIRRTRYGEWGPAAVGWCRRGIDELMETGSSSRVECA